MLQLFNLGSLIVIIIICRYLMLDPLTFNDGSDYLPRALPEHNNEVQVLSLKLVAVVI